MNDNERIQINIDVEHLFMAGHALGYVLQPFVEGFKEGMHMAGHQIEDQRTAIQERKAAADQA